MSRQASHPDTGGVWDAVVCRASATPAAPSSRPTSDPGSARWRRRALGLSIRQPWKVGLGRVGNELRIACRRSVARPQPVHLGEDRVPRFDDCLASVGAQFGVQVGRHQQ